MKASDVVMQLALRLPQFTDKFTSNISVLSLSRSGTTVTATTDGNHGFSTNQAVNILGSMTPIDVVSFTRVGTIGTIVTSTDHDMTKNIPGIAIMSSANEAEFNGTFTVTNVTNRRTIIVSMPDSGPTAATGTPILENGSSALQQYNGLKQITSVPTTTTFTYEVPASFASLNDPVGSEIEARGAPRISSAITLQKIIDAYTAQPAGDLWAFVVLEDVNASKDRNILSDATDNIQRSQHYRQQIMQQCSVYVVFPTSNQIASRSSRDEAEEIFRGICQSILFKRFDTYLYVGEYNPLSFLSHGFAFSNDAFYIHQYVFEQVADILFEDTVGYDEDVAFRDINVDMYLDVGTGEDPLTAAIDLDEEPLP